MPNGAPSFLTSAFATANADDIAFCLDCPEDLIRSANISLQKE